MTGIAVLLLFFGTAIPGLRGSVALERDQEDLSGETVHYTTHADNCNNRCSIHAFACTYIQACKT